MTHLQKAIVGATLVCAIGTAVYEASQTARYQQENLALQQQQAPLGQQALQLRRECDEISQELVLLREQNGTLKRTTPELLGLRSEVGRLRDDSRQLARGQTDAAMVMAAQAWLDRTKFLKQRFEQWPGRPTPELQLLDEQDWLNEGANHDLDSDAACRESMARLRTHAKFKFADAVNEAIEQFAKSNNAQLPADVSQLAPHLKPPLDSWLVNYEIAKAGWINPPQPSSPNSDRARTWALIEKGAFGPDGIQNPSALSDPEYDMYLVIYQGGHYGSGVPRIRK